MRRRIQRLLDSGLVLWIIVLICMFVAIFALSKGSSPR